MPVPPLSPEDLARPGDGWRTRVEDVLDATGAGWRTLASVALAVGVLAGAAWWLLRPPEAPVESTLPVLEPASVTTAAPAARPVDVVVHVAGAVARPGIQRLPSGARVADAVDAAGGPTGSADLARVNLAAPLVDGSQIYVPAVGEAAPHGASAGGGAPADPAAADVAVDLNTATAEQLDALPGVGPATAAAIIRYRDENGPFATIDELLEVRGIGEAKLAQLRDLVRV